MVKRNGELVELPDFSMKPQLYDVDGVQEYVVADDESEIEDVVGRFVAHTLMQIVENAMDDAPEDEEDAPCLCGMKHAPGEFCFCDEVDLLQ